MNKELIRYRYYKNSKVKMFFGRQVIATMVLQDLDQPAAYIKTLSVKIGYQDKGFGSLFMIEVISYCKSKGCQALGLSCSVENTGALRFYKNLGLFICTTIKKDHGNFYFLTLKF
jgi:ribosomal protein S18 acetylase RimI-like enzyme